MIIFWCLEKAQIYGFRIKCPERKNKIRHIKIQTMTPEALGSRVIYLQGIIIAKVYMKL